MRIHLVTSESFGLLVTSSRGILRALAPALALLIMGVPAVMAQKTTTSTFDFPDHVVTVVVPESVKVEKLEDSSFKLTYKVDTYVDEQDYEKRLFVDYKVTLKAPKEASMVALDMAPYDYPAVLHVWNPDDRTAYKTLEAGTPDAAFGDMNYKGKEEKFEGEVKSVGFTTALNPEVGEHEVLIRKFTLE